LTVIVIASGIWLTSDQFTNDFLTFARVGIHLFREHSELYGTDLQYSTRFAPRNAKVKAR